MFLQIVGESDSSGAYSTTFEMVADTLLMINISNNALKGTDILSIPSYWRLVGREVNPPLEVGINTQYKIISKITIFVDVDCMRDIELQNGEAKVANILINTDIFRKVNDFINVNGQYYVSLIGNTLICLFGNDCKISRKYVNGQIEFLSDETDSLCGLVIGSLNESDEKKLMSLTANLRSLS